MLKMVLSHKQVVYFTYVNLIFIFHKPKDKDKVGKHILPNTNLSLANILPPMYKLKDQDSLRFVFYQMQRK